MFELLIGCVIGQLLVGVVLVSRVGSILVGGDLLDGGDSYGFSPGSDSPGDYPSCR